MFSAGVESTALLTLSRPGDVALMVSPHRRGTNPSYIQSNALYILHHYSLRAEFAVVECHSPLWQVNRWAWMSAAMVWVAGDPSIDAVYNGLNIDDGWNGVEKDYFARLDAAWAAAHPSVPHTAPFRFKTKREQWEMIPTALRRFVTSCEISDPPCGQCPKCAERSLAGIPSAHLETE